MTWDYFCTTPALVQKKNRSSEITPFPSSKTQIYAFQMRGFADITAPRGHGRTLCCQGDTASGARDPRGLRDQLGRRTATGLYVWGALDQRPSILQVHPAGRSLRRGGAHAGTNRALYATHR